MAAFHPLISTSLPCHQSQGLSIFYHTHIQFAWVLQLEICTRLPGTDDIQQASRMMQGDSWSRFFNLPQEVSMQQQRKEESAKVMPTRTLCLICKGVGFLVSPHFLPTPDEQLPSHSQGRSVDCARKESCISKDPEICLISTR